jgi:hypothetical protein
VNGFSSVSIRTSSNGLGLRLGLASRAGLDLVLVRSSFR